eukprot:2236400-Rhodomonas_salina.1
MGWLEQKGCFRKWIIRVRLGPLRASPSLSRSSLSWSDRDDPPASPSQPDKAGSGLLSQTAATPGPLRVTGRLSLISLRLVLGWQAASAPGQAGQGPAGLRVSGLQVSDLASELLERLQEA